MALYYQRFSFVTSFETWSSKIRNGVIAMKYWMKQGVNRRNMEIVADEPESVEWKFACDQVLTLLDFPSSNIIFFF